MSKKHSRLGEAIEEAATTYQLTDGPQQGPAPNPAPPNVRSIKLPDGFDLEASGYSWQQIVDAAIAGHQVNKEYCESIGDMSQVDFGDAPDWQGESAVQGVCYAISSDFPSPEAMHENWMKVKIADGWVFGEVKDATAKTHPCMVPYDLLPEAQRKKDDHFRATIMASLGVDMSQKDRDELNRLAGEVLKTGPEPISAEAAAMTGMLQCAAAMCGLLNKEEDAKIFSPDVAMCLADYFRHEPTAPAAGGLMQLKLKLKLDLLPNEDPRRVALILELFRLAVTRMTEFDTEDAKAEAAKLETANFKPAHDRLDGDGRYDKDPGRFEKSDLGKALDSQAKLTTDI